MIEIFNARCDLVVSHPAEQYTAPLAEPEILRERGPKFGAGGLAVNGRAALRLRLGRG